MFRKILHLITWKETALNRHVYNFFVDYNIIDINDNLDILKYLVQRKKKWYKTMFRSIKKFFSVLLSNCIAAILDWSLASYSKDM